METLVHELNLRDARSLVLTARAWADPSATDWRAQQELLDKWWEDNAGLPIYALDNSPLLRLFMHPETGEGIS